MYKIIKTSKGYSIERTEKDYRIIVNDSVFKSYEEAEKYKQILEAFYGKDKT